MIKNIYLIAAFGLMGFTAIGCGDGAGNSSKANSLAAVPPEAPAETAKNQTRIAERVIKVAYLPITHALAGFEAAEQEKLKKETGLNIELVRFGSWTELIDALNTGRVDAAFALAELVMKAREQGIDVYLSTLAHRDGNVIVVGKDIASASDLRGKTFAIPHRQSSHYILLNEALAKEGLTVNDVNIVEMAPPEMPSALAAGQISGYCVAEPFGARAVSLDIGKVLYNSQELWPDSVCCGLAISGRFLKEHPELASRLVAAVKKAGISLDSDHDHEKELASRYFKVSPDTLDLSLKWISFQDLDISREQYESLREKVIKYGLSEKPSAYEDIVRNVE
ncbi:ABC transporter substrate-binding protein [Succinimonas amylolytica]|uniref:ABC transporter substrate-binding protein n=1 Tax=Succinimonas amylolytica TaxID=83769 RepID=UPI0023A7B757